MLRRVVMVSLVILAFTATLDAQRARARRIRPGPPHVSSYPDDTNTGFAPTGVTLTAYSSPCTITSNGTTIDSKDISCCPLLINANNVTIKRSRMNQCIANYLIDNFASGSGGGTGLLVEDTTIIGSGFVKGSSAISTSDFTLRRANISNVENGAYVDGPNVVIEDSYIHNLYCYADYAAQDPHIDAVQIANNGTGITVQHNRLYGTCDRNGAGDGGNSAVHMHTSTTVTITNNILAGGGYSLYCYESAAGATTFYTNNRFSNVFATTVGTTGLTAECDDETHFTGNVCHESGASVTGSTGTCSSPPDPLAVFVRLLMGTGFRLDSPSQPYRRGRETLSHATQSVDRGGARAVRINSVRAGGAFAHTRRESAD